MQEFWGWKNRPLDIPHHPHTIYKLDGWTTWEDWLGKETDLSKKRDYWSFKKARAWMHKVNKINKNTGKQYLYNQTTFNKWGLISRKPDDEQDFTEIGLPKNFPILPFNIPRGIYYYKNDPDWQGMAEFLGYERIADRLRVYKSFKDARKFVHKLGFKNNQEWIDYINSDKIPQDIHKHPKKHYKKEWIRWGDWIGNYDYYSQFELQQLRKNVTYRKALIFVRKLKLNSSGEYREYCRGNLKLNGMPYPVWLPAKPDNQFRGKGWKNWGEFLGSGEVAAQKKKFWSYEKSSSYLRRLKKVNTWADFRRYKKGEIDGYSKCPEGIPSVPYNTYKDKWKGWSKFLNKNE